MAVILDVVDIVRPLVRDGLRPFNKAYGVHTNGIMLFCTTSVENECNLCLT